MSTARTYTEGQYVITASGDDYWHATSATTLNGAQVIARQTYRAAVGGKIEIAIVVGTGELQRFEPVAVKYGHDSWVSD